MGSDEKPAEEAGKSDASRLWKGLGLGCTVLMYLSWAVSAVMVWYALFRDGGKYPELADHPCWTMVMFAIAFTLLHLFFKYELFDALAALLDLLAWK